MDYFKLYNGCKLVKGHQQSMIYDLERVDNSNLIPNSLYDILTEHQENSISEIKSLHKNQYDQVIDEYFDFLISNEYVFLCEKEDLKKFPTIEFNWKSPNPITNAIIDYDGTTSIDLLNKFIKELSFLKCQAVEFRSFDAVRPDWLDEFLTLFKKKSITSLELVLRYHSNFNEETVEEILVKYPRVQKMKFYSAPEEKVMENVEYVKEHINPEIDCGNIHPKYFSIGFDTYSEAKSCNSCLNQKVSLSRKGQIKGCPSMTSSFGAIQENSIQDILNKGEIQEDWLVSKDEVDICSDCEYRYCCTDCRVFTDKGTKKHSRPSKCSYNPYIGVWKGENGYEDVYEWLKKNTLEK